MAWCSEEPSNGYWACALPPPHPPGSQSVQREALNYSFCWDGGWFFKSLLKVEVKQKADWAGGVQQCSQVGRSVSVRKCDQREWKPTNSTSSAGKNTNLDFLHILPTDFPPSPQEWRGDRGQACWVRAKWVIHSVKAEAQPTAASRTLNALRKTYYGAVCFSRHGTVAAWQRAGAVTIWNTENITNSEGDPANRMWVPLWGGGELRHHGRRLCQTTSAADETVSDRTRAEKLMDQVMFWGWSTVH